ncbi:MAG TPA: cupin domain-containing protein [Candidatus Dormibacteraeota bacterium]|nr:cupin domain-containing protein [Candidatus Dormibacteraeota bacterium]
MSPNEPRRPAGWKPNDKVIEGRIGAQRVAAALKNHGIVIKDQVITSRDEGMDDVLFELRRPDMPPGIQSWQLPVILDKSTFVFLTVAEPGAIVPTHTHSRNLFRVVISGSIITDGKELKSGDWMFVPKGAEYSYHAALNPGAVTMHFYE